MNTWSVGPSTDDPPILDEHQAPAVEGRQIQVVHGAEHREAPGLVQIFEDLEDLQLLAHVQRRGGLIQEQDFRVLGQGPGDHHPLAFPPGDLGDRPFLEVRRGGPAHGLQGPDQVRVRQGPQAAPVRDSGP